MLPTDPKDRKATPIFSGVVKYFPLALAEIARVSKAGNDQHNPGQPLHWDKSKSTDHADCILRHIIDAGTIDSDGMRHSAKVAWRALAMLETELSVEDSYLRCLIHPTCKEPAGHQKCECCGKGVGGVCGACHCQLNRIRHTLTEYGDEKCEQLCVDAPMWGV